MNLTYAVERLLDTGWPAAGIGNSDLESLPDGRPYPTPEAVRQEFAAAGLELSLKHEPTFNCCRATWAPAGRSADADAERSESSLRGTVVGSCEKEAAVYALAQLRAADRQLAV
jgi:hypothetical protein